MPGRRRVLLIVALAAAAVVWAISHFRAQPQWQSFSVAGLGTTLAHANRSFLLLATALTFASYLFRSFRWRAFLRPMKAASLRGIFSATLIGFSAVALASRAGEIVRPWLIARNENLSLASQIGAWTLERVFDTLMLVVLLGLALWSMPVPAQSTARVPLLLAHFRSAGVLLTIVAILLAGLLALLRYFPGFISALLGFFARPLPQRYRRGLRSMLEQFSATLAAVESAGRFLACAWWTILVWLTLAGAYWCTAQALGAPLSRLHLGAMVLLMVASATGSVAYVPGVGGGAQLAVILTLTEIFAIPVTLAASYALAVWAITFLLVLIPGLPLAAKEGLSWRGLGRITAPASAPVPSEPRP